MDAPPKGNMAIGLALNIEVVGIGELRLVTISRANPGHDHLTRLDLLIANHRLSFGYSGHSFHWRVITQSLLYSSWHQPAIFAQAFNYPRILIEAEDHIAKQIGCCLVARNQQQPAEA